ncbi:MAG: cellulase family glycosylhydrolase [Deltaproteobacteria bacterium]|nr:cellulase family glycosylhydrolase [Deltaproteobacteria bacterium]
MRAWVFVVLAACGSGHGKSDAPAVHGEASGDTSGSADEWLDVVGTHIVHHADGTRFHGRGADLHDERSCEACSFMPANPAGVDRWSDELIDNWHASFIRFLLSAKKAPFNAGEVQWKSLVDDPQYLADIVQNVTHMTSKPGVYVEVTVFADPSMKTEMDGGADSEWPNSAGDTLPVYRALAEAFHDNPRVLFGLTNEPHGPANQDAALAAMYATAIQAIRQVEDSHGTPHHIIVAQAPENYARDLTYFVANPLAGDRIIYEVHPYNTQADFDRLITQPAMHLPIMIGEYGPAGVMTNQDIQALWPVAQAAEVPYIAWVFHQRCPPSMLQDTASDGCGLDAATGYNFPRTAWGDLLHDHLATPW